MLKLYPLPYNEDAIAPIISAETMDVHYNKHYRGYHEKTNAELKRLGIAPDMLEILWEGSYNNSEKLKDNFGGYYNHSIFWYMLRPTNSLSDPRENTIAAIQRDFGSWDSFREEFLKAAKGRFGSGWTWWVFDPASGTTQIISTPNQDFPEMDEYGAKIPLLGVDVWEHAYYLDYKSDRAEYTQNVLDYAINWDYIEERLNTALSNS
jgi:superoxide dismutase, Fe-Mn family